MSNFLERYHYSENTIQQLSQQLNPADKIRHVLAAAKNQKIYLLIDEYDHFANSLMADDLNHFRSIMGKGGFVRAFYEVLKAGTQQGILDRLFITGVTPIMLDSLTSGFNVVENLSLHPSFNEAIGFTRAETEFLVKPLTEVCALSLEPLMEDVKNGTTVINSLNLLVLCIMQIWCCILLNNLIYVIALTLPICSMKTSLPITARF